jgi:hypothetical protein
MRAEIRSPHIPVVVSWSTRDDHGGDEDLRGGDDLVAGGMMLAEPGLVEPELIEVLDQLQVALEGQGRVLAHGVERGQEDAEIQVICGLNGGHGRERVLSLSGASAGGEAAGGEAGRDMNVR